MKPIQKQLKLGKVEYFHTHLSIINSMLPTKMTPKEIEVLAQFMSFDGTLADDRFGPTGRKMVKTAMGLSDGGLANYVKTLRAKRLIREENMDGHLVILPTIMVDPDYQEYHFRLIKDLTINVSPTQLTAGSETNHIGVLRNGQGEVSDHRQTMSGSVQSTMELLQGLPGDGDTTGDQD